MPKKIIHLPYNQGNFVSSFQHAERMLGAHSTLIAAPNKFVQPPDIRLPESHWRKPQTIAAFFKARNSDILAFNYGTSLFNAPSRRYFLLDLPYYSSHTKKLMIFQGSDARIRYRQEILDSREYEKSLGHTVQNITNDGFIPAREVSLKHAKIAKIDKYIDRIFYFNPDLSSALPTRAKFMHYPFLRQSAISIPGIDTTRPMRVLHLSTNRVLKGTGLIEQAIRAAQKSINFEVKICVRVPRQEAMAAMDWADVLIDQVGLGWYGMQAVEALSRGKIVICSIDQNHWATHVPEYLNKSSGIINASHNDLPKVLTELLENPDKRKALALAGMNFVRDIHDPLKIVRTHYGDWINGHN